MNVDSARQQQTADAVHRLGNAGVAVRREDARLPAVRLDGSNVRRRLPLVRRGDSYDCHVHPSFRLIRRRLVPFSHRVAARGDYDSPAAASSAAVSTASASTDAMWSIFSG